jgi:hypothetical protein
MAARAIMASSVFMVKIARVRRAPVGDLGDGRLELLPCLLCEMCRLAAENWSLAGVVAFDPTVKIVSCGFPRVAIGNTIGVFASVVKAWAVVAPECFDLDGFSGCGGHLVGVVGIACVGRMRSPLF